MRRIIKALLVKSSNAPEEKFPETLEMVPASGTMETNRTKDDQGYLTTYKLRLRVRKLHDNQQRMIEEGCICTVRLDGPGPMSAVTLGTPELPMFFTIDDDLGSVTLSASWKIA